MGRRGSVFILAMWAALMLGMIAMALGSRGSAAIRVINRAARQAEAAAAASGGLQLAVAVLGQDETTGYDLLNETWAIGETAFAARPVGDGRVTIRPGTLEGPPRYGLSDEERKLNLNTAPHELLAGLVREAGGLPADQAGAVAQAIEDWRDEDRDQRQAGAEQFYYLGLEVPYACKDGPFDVVEELALVRGVTPQLLLRLRPYVTVYGGGTININTASETILRAAGLSPAGVLGVRQFRAGEDDVPGTADDRPIIAPQAIAGELALFVPLEDLALLSDQARDGVWGVRSDVFSADIEAVTSDGRQGLSVACIFDRDGRVLAWEER
ncbi:MAG TPA: hypothetical protein VGB20_02230 [bacterium]